jgi:hypothetical protein
MTESAAEEAEQRMALRLGVSRIMVFVLSLYYSVT